MILEFGYYDDVNWVSVTSKEVNWTNPSKKYKPERVQPAYVEPTIVRDINNGQEHDVQHIIHEGKSAEIYIKESEIHDIQRLKSCTNIIIKQHNKEDGVYTLDVMYTADTTISDYFIISEPERIDTTSSWKIVITFRTNRTVINKTIAQNQNYSIELDSGFNYSKYETSPIFEEKNSIVEPWTDDEDRVLLSYTKTGLEILLYFARADLTTFLGNLKSSSTVRINGTLIKEYSYEQEQIGVDLVSVRIKGIISTVPTYFLTFTLYNLTINGTPYYTDLLPVLTDSNSSIETYENQTGVDKPAKAISRTVKQISFFMTEVNALALKYAWEQSIKQVVTLNGVTVLERNSVDPERLGEDLYKLSINCTIDATTI